MTSISKKELEDLKKVELEILIDFANFCDKHNLTYFLVGGTLLGSIRHKGFIPWDDDIDVGMPRSDYEKFLELYSKDTKSKYYVQSLETDSSYWQCYAKVRKSHTLVIESAIKDLNINKEIGIDIFPFDLVSANSYSDVKVRATLIRSIRDTIQVKKNIKGISDCHHKIISLILKIFSIKRLYKTNKKLMTKDNNKDCNILMCFLMDYKIEKEFNEKSIFYPLKEGDFEGYKFKLPNNYDYYLTHVYGDYMKLPKKEDRVTHGIIKVDINKGEVDE